MLRSKILDCCDAAIAPHMMDEAINHVKSVCEYFDYIEQPYEEGAELCDMLDKLNTFVQTHTNERINACVDKETT